MFTLQLSKCMLYYSPGIVLVTDSIAATGLPDGPYKFGEQKIFVDSNTAKVEGTNILAGR